MSQGNPTIAMPGDEEFDPETMKKILDDVTDAVKATDNPIGTYKKLITDHDLDKRAFMYGMLYTSWIDFTLIFPALASAISKRKGNFVSKRFKKYMGR